MVRANADDVAVTREDAADVDMVDHPAGEAAAIRRRWRRWGGCSG